MENIIKSAIEHIEKLSDDDAASMIMCCAVNTQFMNWEIRINSSGEIYSDSDLHSYGDDECVLAQNDIGGHGPTLFLEWFGFELDEEGDWSLPEECNITVSDVINYLTV